MNPACALARYLKTSVVQHPMVSSTPNTLYVETNGSDSTGVIGNPALPVATAQKAYEIWRDAVTKPLIHFGVGTFSGFVANASMSVPMYIIGEGAGLSIINSITTTGVAGTSSDAVFDENSSLVTASSTTGPFNGLTLNIVASAITIYSIYSVGGKGYDQYAGDTSPYYIQGSNGATGGTISLTLYSASTLIADVTGGQSGDTSNSTWVENGGNGGTITVNMDSNSYVGTVSSNGATDNYGSTGYGGSVVVNGGKTDFAQAIAAAAGNFSSVAGSDGTITLNDCTCTATAGATLTAQRSVLGTATATTVNLQGCYYNTVTASTFNNYGIDGTISGTPSSNTILATF